MPKLKLRAIMLDLDGTLIHTAPELTKAAGHMLAALGLPVLGEAQITTFIGEGAAMLIKRCLQGDLHAPVVAEPTADQLLQAQALFFEYYAKFVAESRPYSGVIASLKAMRNAGFTLACVTNKPQKFTLPLLAANDMLQYFELVVSGDTLAKKKPDPDQLLYVAEKLAVDIRETLLIGDSKTDISAARSAGCYVFAVPYGYNQGEPIDAQSVDGLVATIGEALDLIQTQDEDEAEATYAI